MRAAAEGKLRIPEDLSVIGVDDIPLARFLPVALSTIKQPLAEMARRVVEMLIERIEQPEKAGVERAVFEATYIERESVGLVPKAKK